MKKPSWMSEGLAHRRLRSALLALAAIIGVAAPAAHGQAGPYLLTEIIPVGGGQGCGVTPQVRTITVADSFTITDLNVGIIADHPYRRDIQFDITSPASTTVRLINGPAGGSGADDLNVLLDQASAGGTINSDTGNHDSTVAPYQRNRQPDNSLNAFNGQQAQGDWTITLCDTFTGIDDGSVSRVQLLFNNIVPPVSDLSLAMVVDDAGPDFGEAVTYTLTVTNGGPNAASGVSVAFNLPSGVGYTSDTGGGAYSNATGIWTLPGTIANGASASLSVTGSVLTSGSYAAQAEISTSSSVDPDSTPANSADIPFEDDTAHVSITPGYSGTPGIAPILSCTLPEHAFDWAASGNAWPVNTDGGATSETRAYPGGGSDGLDFTFSFTGDYIRRAAFGGSLSPFTSTAGNFGSTDMKLVFGQDLVALSESIMLTVSVGTPGIGVEALQFEVSDIDFGSGSFRDRIDIAGSLNGQAVSPVLTASVANQIMGDAAIGTAIADNGTTNGLVTVTFLQPVDTVSVEYFNLDAVLGFQVLAYSDIAYCPRPIDYGDAPSGYPSAGHAVRPGYRIGATMPDGESGMQFSAGADGDDTAGSNDEDLSGPAAAYTGSTVTLNVPASGTGGFLQAWIDWNGDQDFDDAGEQVASDVTLTGGSVDLSIAVPAAAALGDTVMRVRWSTASGLGPDGIAMDGEVEDFLFTVLAGASLSGSKTITVFDPDSEGLHAIPGRDVIYTISVANSGAGPTDLDTMFLVDALPGEVEFWNGDIDAGGPDTYPGTDPVGVVQSNGAAMTFDYAADVAFSTGPGAPADFSDCSAVLPDDTYRADIRFICLRPRGQLVGGDPDPEIAFSFRARIR